jgi:hypothetical protein
VRKPGLGPRVAICDECVNLGKEIIDTELSVEPGGGDTINNHGAAGR